MYNIQIKNLGRKRTELFLLSLCIILYVVRTTIPALKYPFVLLFILLGTYILLKKRERLFLDFLDFKNFPTTLFLLFLYILVACIISDKIYLFVIKDIINILIIFILMLMVLVFAAEKNDLRVIHYNFLILFMVFALYISLNRIYTYFYAASYQYEILSKGREIADSNFALLPVFFGMIGCLFFLQSDNNSKRIYFFNLLLFVFSITVLLSGSRRGLIVFLSFYLIILILQLWALTGIFTKNKRTNQNTFGYFVSFTLCMVFAVLIFPKTSIYFKNNILEGLGIGNKAYLKNQISQTITSYWHFIDNEVNGEEVYAKLWKPVFDPKDPEAGIGNGNYKIIKTISGKNVEIVPQGSKGYLIDSSCIGDSSETHAYYFNLIDAPIVEDGDSIAASVYCYVSDDFNGTEAAFRAVGALTGNSDAYYDMNEKGSWQKLIMPVNCTNGELKIYLYMNKGGVRNFSTLEGYVVFAYPEILRVAGREKIRVTSEKDDLKISSSYSQVELSEAKLLQNINIGYLSNIKKTTLFPISELSGYALKKGLDNSDIIRKWIAKIVSEDTVYSGFEAAIEVPRNIDKFGDDRASRWKFAVEIYTKEYNWIKKSFGGGYNFLNWYGYYFLGDKTKSDYPHNPFLHVLLYSGILGLLIYLIFLYRVVYYYLRYIKEFPLFFILFLLTYYFTIFSGGSPFDPPIMGIFMVLPFTIHCVLKRDVSNQ